MGNHDDLVAKRAEKNRRTAKALKDNADRLKAEREARENDAGQQDKKPN